MAEAYKFPDEIEEKPEAATPEIEIELVDDTPPEDRGREPLPKEIVEELEKDDLEEYSDKVKKRLSQMKKVWHDERREKEAAAREREEALRFAQIKEEENRQLRQRLGAGQKLVVEEKTKSANIELAAAKDRLKEAYESGDGALIADAQEALMDAKRAIWEVGVSEASLQSTENGVEHEVERVQAPRQAPPDPRAEAWARRNDWFGVDEEMTALALGLHEKLVRSGVDPTSQDYYRRVDETMRKRFPEKFEEERTQPTEPVEKPTPRRAAQVVAPATRSTAPTKVRLTQTQLALAKKMNISPEAYAKEVMKLENNNG
jgi:hypothetical protein